MSSTSIGDVSRPHHRTFPELDFQDLKVISAVGHGAKGVVFAAMKNDDDFGEHFVLKVISKALIQKKTKSMDNDEGDECKMVSFEQQRTKAVLVQNLHRLPDSDPETAAVYNTLATIENLIEVKPSVAELVCEKTKLLKWLLGKIKVREFDGNKQYASEILAILLQNSTANQKRLGQMNGVDVVLQAVAMYKSKDPKSSDEEEMVENLFDCLCCLLMHWRAGINFVLLL